MNINDFTFIRGQGVNVFDHYWAIGGDTAHVYSSATNVMVPVKDKAFVDWQTGNGAPTPIPDEDELRGALKAHGLRLPEWVWAAPSFIQPKAGVYSRDQLLAYAAHLRAEKVASVADAETRLRALELRTQGDGELFDKVFPAIDEAYRNEAEAVAHIASGKATKLEQVSAAFG